MILMLLTCLFSFACLLVSLLALGILLIHTNANKDGEMKSNDDEAVLISGCDSGIGLELAKFVYKSTNYTVICGFLKMSTSDGYRELEEIVSQDKSSRLIMKKLDITSESDIARINQSIDELKNTRKIKYLVALINNAGTMTYGEFDWLTWNQIQSQIDVNLVGTIRLTRAVMPHLIESKGRIINVSSVNDMTVFPGLSIYSATKSALSAFSRGLGYELRKFGVHVVTFRLGDFARLTNIMAGHEDRRDDMWKEMDLAKRGLYGDFFHEFNEHLLKNYGLTSPINFRDSNLFPDFKRALLRGQPPHTITCAPVKFRLFYFILELLPTSLQYCLLDLLLQFSFKWNPSRQQQQRQQQQQHPRQRQ